MTHFYYQRWKPSKPQPTSPTQRIRSQRIKFQTIMLTRRGYTVDQIAEIAGASLTTIYTILREHGQKGTNGKRREPFLSHSLRPVDRFMEANS